MRCPECQKRNSVAAHKCKFCGAKFKRKTMSMGKKLALFGLSVVLGGSVYLACMLPKMVDPAEQLSAAAKKVAGGSKSAEEAKQSKASLDDAIKKLLLRYGGDTPSVLSKRIKTCLPPNAFEVLVVELPKGLKLVEIDTVLQPSDFLIMKGTNEIKVFPLPGFEVYDDCKAVNDRAGAVLVLLGHSGGQLPHRPLIQTFALLPDSIFDETATMVPSISGEGTAKFAKDNSDINLELSLPLIAQSEKINMNPAISQDKTMRLKYQWKEDKYVPTAEIPADLSSEMLILARSLKHPELASAIGGELGPQAAKLVKEQQWSDAQEMVIIKREDKHKSPSSLYTIASSKKKLDLELKKLGPDWQLVSYTVSETAPAVANTNQNKTAAPVDNATATPVIGTAISTNPPVDSTPVSNQNPIQNTAATSANKTATAGDKQAESKGSTWLDDENKTSVAVLPNTVKNSSPDKKADKEKERKEKEKAEKEKQEREKQEKDRQEKDRQEKERLEKEKLEKEKKDKKDKEKKDKEESSGGGSGKISDNLGTGSVRLRSGPGLNTNTIDEIPRGTKIQIIGQKKGWYKVNYGGKIGYVFAPLVDAKGGSGASKEASSPGKT
ncbi:MAG: SH3 domain-containing protein, partial [Candidatus Obscuribacterales bacterium]|nr:SH3 domain-containing protein [Candidatus Obscuribacterales bacterium]